MFGFLDRMFEPTQRDIQLGGLLGVDPKDLRMQAWSNALMQAGHAMTQAGSPSTAPRSPIAGLTGGLLAGTQGFNDSYTGALRHGAGQAQLARWNAQAADAAELRRLKGAAALEHETGGRKIPTQAAANYANGNPIVTAATGQPQAPYGLLQRAALSTPDVPPVSAHDYGRHHPDAPPPGILGALNNSMGLPASYRTPGINPNASEPTGPSGAPVSSSGAPLINPVTGAKTTGGSRDTAGMRDTSYIPPQAGGIPPALGALLLHQSPATYANIRHQQNKPHFLSRGEKMVDGSGRTLAEGAPFPDRAPTVRKAFDDDGNEIRLEYVNGAWQQLGASKTPTGSRGDKAPTVKTFYDEETGQAIRMQWVNGAWEQVGGAKAPTARTGRGPGELTEAQRKHNDETDTAFATADELGLLDPQTFKRVTQRFDPLTLKENPNYMPGADALIRKATRRKYGDDPEFETRYRRFYGAAPGAEAPKPQGAASTSAAPVAIPTLPSGGIDRSKTKHGQIYELPDGRRVKVDTMTKSVTVVE